MYHVWQTFHANKDSTAGPSRGESHHIVVFGEPLTWVSPSRPSTIPLSAAARSEDGPYGVDASHDSAHKLRHSRREGGHARRTLYRYMTCLCYISYTRKQAPARTASYWLRTAVLSAGMPLCDLRCIRTYSTLRQSWNCILIVVLYSSTMKSAPSARPFFAIGNRASLH